MDDDPIARIESLWRQHSKAVFLHALYLLRDPEKATDVVQDVFVQALHWLTNNPGRLKDDNLRAWLKTITMNVVRMGMRRAVESVTLSGVEERLIEPRSVDTLESSERLAALKNCLAKLGAAERDLVALVLDKAMKSGEIANELGVTPGAARTRLHRVRNNLRQCIQAELGL